MTSHADIARFANKAYKDALKKDATAAHKAAVNKAKELGLEAHTAQTIVDEIARIHLINATKSVKGIRQ